MQKSMRVRSELPVRRSICCSHQRRKSCACLASSGGQEEEEEGDETVLAAAEKRRRGGEGGEGGNMGHSARVPIELLVRAAEGGESTLSSHLKTLLH